MKGKIFRIDPPKASINPGEMYTRVHFEILDGPKRYSHTDIVPTYRNYNNWKNLLEVGNILDNLKEYRIGKVNADSRPVFISKEIPTQKVETPKNLKLI